MSEKKLVRKSSNKFPPAPLPLLNSPSGDNEIDLICPNIYLGSLLGAQETEQLRKTGITHVLTVAESPLDWSERSSFIYLYKQLVDAPWSDLLCILNECIEFIRVGSQEPNRVLVHW